MQTTQELIDRYDGYSDEELYAMFAQIDQYTPEATEALEHVVKQKGGIDALKKRLQLQAETMQEIERLVGETRKLLLAGTPPEQVKQLLASSQVLSQDRIVKIVDDCVATLERQTNDRKIKPRTLLGSLVGGLLGGSIGGIVLGVSLIQSDRIFVLFLLGLVLLSYGFIRGFTRQSSSNSVVAVATVLASLYGLGLGWVLYEMYR